MSFTPPWLLRNAHVQSILPSLKLRKPLLARRVRAMLTASQSILLDCGDGVRLLGMHSPQPSAVGARGELVVLIHGWEGSADSLYIMSLAGYLFDHGFDVFRLNLRDHGPTHHLNEDIFHSCRIAEVVGAVRAIQEQLKPAALSLAGFSLGGNFCLRVAARAPAAQIRLRKVIAICPVLSPHRTMEALEAGWFGYQRYFIQKWKRSLREKQIHFPKKYDFAEIFKEQSLSTMTDVLVRRHSEFADVNSYLNGYAIVGDALADLKVESHVVLAADDPIIPVRDVDGLAKSAALHIKVLNHGGHCGFVDRLGRESFADRTTLDLLSK
jgi:predicted alpha/beta-fold hydrolase